MDGDARGSGAGIEESGRGGLILSRGSPPARWFDWDEPLLRPGTEEQGGEEDRCGEWAGWGGPAGG
jgi:hypothetical protein